MAAKITSLLFLAAGAASAQITNTYGDNGGTTGTLSAIGYDSWQHAFTSGNRQGQPDPTIGAQGPNAFGNNWVRANYAGWTDPNDPGAGYQLSGMTLTLYVDGGGPPGTQTFNIYSGNGGNTPANQNVIGSFTLTWPGATGNYVTINIPTSVYASGFNIGWHTNNPNSPSFNQATEHHSTLAFRPQVSLTYTEVIPEPSAVLLGSLGLFPLLRRRR